VSLSLIMRGIYPQLSQETMSLIHSSAWKGNSRKFGCTILHRSPSGSREGGFWGHLRHVCEAYMLWCCIKIRRHE
jgi:hypothetical protein